MVITNDQELAVTQQRIRQFHELLLQLRQCETAENYALMAIAYLLQDLVGLVADGALQEYKQGTKANRRTPELCSPSVECRRLSSRAWLPIAISFAETRDLPTSAVISLGSFLVPIKPYKGCTPCKL